ncbi:DUF262 domain-containing protein [Oceanimonas smirnovii]|uniref:DUF262 domain-containing protein n=1 Tax=Oceanimonas smirnovii TaxID=264574 RepID=UPI00038000B9|nr:DUF262 domain-containing protein [Oceanimonas smirnovii]
MNLAVNFDKRELAEGVATSVVKVAEVLANSQLSIPIYQRPYKWQVHHVEQLLEDIARHKDKTAYRLGTLVLHQHMEGDKEKHDIVDGQQRTITLLLIVKAILAEKEKLGLCKSEPLRQQLAGLQLQMFKPEFASDASQQNIRRNYQAIRRRVMRADFNEEQIDFLLNRCELVKVTLSELSEAFQFFDAQNARGRDLAPHDLLKAYHLREFSQDDEPLKASTVYGWENSNTEELASLFGKYLYRIRSWVKGESARYFGKDDVALFKGVNLDNSAYYPCMAAIRIAHHTVDDYNAHFTRRIDAHSMPFPFQLDQVMINGRRFFEMIGHYQALIKGGIRHKGTAKPVGPLADLDGFAPEILTVLNSYDGRHRRGDGYVRLMFDCLLMYYYDKFGATDLGRAIEKIFIWAYSLRLNMQTVKLASMDNHVLKYNLFRELRDATHPQRFLQYSLPVVEKVNSSKTSDVDTLFRKMGYLTGDRK